MRRRPGTDIEGNSKEDSVTDEKKSHRRDLRALAVLFVVLLAPILGSAGEFKISRYIEPNQMSNLFTRHVRKGIIKRIGLSEAQLYEIREAIDPHREKLLAHPGTLPLFTISMAFPEVRWTWATTQHRLQSDEQRARFNVRIAHCVCYEAQVETSH